MEFHSFFFSASTHFFFIRVTTPNQISKNQRITQHKLNPNLQPNLDKFSSNTSAGTHELRRMPYSFYVVLWAKEEYEKLSDDAGSTEKHFSSDYPYLLVLGPRRYLLLVGLDALKTLLKSPLRLSPRLCAALSTWYCGRRKSSQRAVS